MYNEFGSSLPNNDFKAESRMEGKSEGRIRKASSYYTEDEHIIHDDKEFSKLINVYQKYKVAKKKLKKDPEQQEHQFSQPEHRQRKKSWKKTAEKNMEIKIPDYSDFKLSAENENLRVADEHDEYYEKFMAEASANRSSNSVKPIISKGTSGSFEEADAFRKSVKETHSLLLDWSSAQARLVGVSCKVYWELDERWYYGRIINYDSARNQHHVYYSEDNILEWINLNEDTVLVAYQIIDARYSAAKTSPSWPALRYWVSPKATEIVSELPGYKHGISNSYVEYCSDLPAKEYAFVPEKQICLHRFEKSTNSMSKRMQIAHETARLERRCQDRIISLLVAETKVALFSSNDPLVWIGRKVKTSALYNQFAYDTIKSSYSSSSSSSSATSSLPSPVSPANGLISASEMGGSSYGTRGTRGATRVQVDNDTTVLPKIATERSYSTDSWDSERQSEGNHIGLVIQYCAGSGEHLVLFDSAELEPRWMVLCGSTAYKHCSSGSKAHLSMPDLQVFLGPIEELEGGGSNTFVSVAAGDGEVGEQLGEGQDPSGQESFSKLLSVSTTVTASGASRMKAKRRGKRPRDFVGAGVSCENDNTVDSSEAATPTNFVTSVLAESEISIVDNTSAVEEPESYLALTGGIPVSVPTCIMCNSSEHISSIQFCCSCEIVAHSYCMPADKLEVISYHQQIKDEIQKKKQREKELEIENNILKAQRNKKNRWVIPVEDSIASSAMAVDATVAVAASQPASIDCETSSVSADERSSLSVNLDSIAISGNEVSVSAPPIVDAVKWRCWRCVACESCGASFWAQPLRQIDMNRLDQNIPVDTVRVLCGLCMHRFKYKKDFCPICYKTYLSEEEEMAISAQVASASLLDAACGEVLGSDSIENHDAIVETGSSGSKSSFTLTEGQGEGVHSSASPEVEQGSSTTEVQDDVGTSGFVATASAPEVSKALELTELDPNQFSGTSHTVDEFLY